MARAAQQSGGFSLIEMLVVIIVVGIMAGVALESMTANIQDARQNKTEREMNDLSKAIVGDPGLTQNGRRSDFGYVGDIGAFPPNLQALLVNPGYSTWDGPYIRRDLAQDSVGYRTDEWGTAYSYSGGILINSTGSGSTVTRKIADASSDYLRNSISGIILDAAASPPGVTYVDSIDIDIEYPNGSGGTTSKTYQPNLAGLFLLDSIPVGTHPLRVIYLPNVDTLHRYLTVLPRHKGSVSYQFASAYFGSGTTPSGTFTYTLRPDGAGSITNFTRSGCAVNYDCVNEETADDNGSYVIRASNQYRTDVYSLDDPPGTSGTINGVTVHCRARRVHNQGLLMPTLYVNSTEYNSASQNLTTSWADYSYEWTTSPATGSAWTWSEITNLQAGMRMRGQNHNFPAYCTQVWIEVSYTL